jgi:hypothetical protein
LKRQFFFTTLFLPLIIIWFAVIFLRPAAQWVRGD